MTLQSLINTIAVYLLLASPALAEDQTVTYRILGLATPDRQDDLREDMKTIANVELVSIDYDKAQCTLRFNVAKLFPDANPKKPPKEDDIFTKLRDQLNGASLGTFKLKPMNTLSKAKLQRIDIKIAILDCAACRLGAYYTLANLDGVEQANVSEKPSQVTAWIDPSKTNREALIEALKKARVEFPAE
jgi:hypothetical protein